MKLSRALLATVFYLALLVGGYIAYMQWMKVDVVFYATLFVALLATVGAAMLLFGLRMFTPLSRFEKAQLVLIWLLLGYAAAISGPTLIDRSLSFYILEKLDQRGGAIRRDRFEWIFTGEYLREHRLVDVRLTEQLESGTVRIDGDCVVLTPWGRTLAQFGRLFRAHLLPKQRLLLGEYTDQLTDPFRRSDAAPDYLCIPAADTTR